MINYIESKSILSKLKNDIFFGISYNMNLYRGCQHGCIYCDTRSECYGINDISKISVKTNAIELLNKELRSKKQKGTIGTGSMNDPYMPIEKEIQITRKALETINKYKFPVHIITKSNLVERDSDILQEINKTYAAVSFTITTYDDKLSKKLEPCAPKSSDRFKALSYLSEKGIYSGITLMPVLPFINDTVGNIEDIVNKAKDSGAKYIIAMFGVTLRKGSRDYFYNALDKSFEGMKDRYDNYYHDQYECWSPNHKALNDKFMELTDKYGIPFKMDFYKPEAYIQQSLF